MTQVEAIQEAVRTGSWANDPPPAAGTGAGTESSSQPDA